MLLSKTLIDNLFHIDLSNIGRRQDFMSKYGHQAAATRSII